MVTLVVAEIERSSSGNPVESRTCVVRTFNRTTIRLQVLIDIVFKSVELQLQLKVDTLFKYLQSNSSSLLHM